MEKKQLKRVTNMAQGIWGLRLVLRSPTPASVYTQDFKYTSLHPLCYLMAITCG